MSGLILQGGGLSLHNVISGPASTYWSEYAVLFTEGGEAGWKVDSPTGPAATEAQFKAVLSDLQSLRIRGEYIDGYDEEGLDNVVLNGAPAPQPGTLLLLGSGFLGLAAFRRNRHPEQLRRAASHAPAAQAMPLSGGT